jgi:hypothetical protein
MAMPEFFEPRLSPFRGGPFILLSCNPTGGAA